MGLGFSDRGLGFGVYLEPLKPTFFRSSLFEFPCLSPLKGGFFRVKVELTI